jgi:putative glutamine amidotransferase
MGEVIGVKRDLVKFANMFGDVVFLSNMFNPNVSAIMLPGGADVDTKRYGQVPGWWTGTPDPALEYFDTQILPHYLDKLPVIGICRGMQTLNVLAGGTLHQHIYILPKWSKHGSDLVESVRVDDGTRFGINSYHHQAVDKPGDGMRVIATDFLNRIEAIEGSKMFGVQWHPERMLNEKGQFTDMWTINKIEALLAGSPGMT